MTPKPILFSRPMVLAILKGLKTQTRRVIKPVPSRTFTNMYPYYVEGQRTGNSSHPEFGMFDDEKGSICYGSTPVRPNDLLYVRETFGYTAHDEIVFRADGEEPQNGDGWHETEMRWKPSIFMPKKYSRITLRVTVVKVERLQELSNDDAIAEGILREDLPNDPDGVHPPGSYGYVSGIHPFPEGKIHVHAREAFQELWDSINAKRKGGIYAWDKNPWVAAYTFKPVFKNVLEIANNEDPNE